MASVIRMLRWFEKDPGDRLVGEVVMPDAGLAELQALFKVPSDNSMYDCWPVGPARAPALSALAGVPVDLSRFDYFVEAYAASEGGSRLYAIQPGQGYFDAGMTGDGRQVLMGLYRPDVVAIFFGASGDLIGHEARRLEFLRRSGVIVDGGPIEGTARHYDIYDERIPPRIAAWQAELEFRPATIRLKRFFLDELGIGIEDHPGHFGEILDDPGTSDEEKDEIRESMRLWDADGQFVLLWGNDYWLDDSGEVTSS